MVQVVEPKVESPPPQPEPPPPAPIAVIPPLPKAPLKYPAVMVYLPDGSLGVVNHLKPDGTLGVRPVDQDGNYFANLSAHWTPEQRQLVPHELVFKPAELKPVVNPPRWSIEN